MDRVKCQSNTEIAGSPEIALGLALEVESIGGRALIGLGAIPVTEPSQTTNGYTYTGSQTVNDKVHCQEGNSPEHLTKVPNATLMAKDVEFQTTRMLA